MKSLLLLLLVAGTALGQPILSTTPYTRSWLKSADAGLARTNLGIFSTNDSVLTVNQTNLTIITNLFSTTNLNASFATNAGAVTGLSSNSFIHAYDANGNPYLDSSNQLTVIGGTLTLTNGTRTFQHDGTATTITNSATLTSTRFTDGQIQQWYNGFITATMDKTNGIITASGFDGFTNAWTVDTAFPVGKTNMMVSIGTATAGIPSIANVPTSTERYGQLLVVATGTVTFTNAASIAASDYTTSRTITNGNCAMISIDVWPGVKTNMFISQTK